VGIVLRQIGFTKKGKRHDLNNPPNLKETNVLTSNQTKSQLNRLAIRAVIIFHQSGVPPISRLFGIENWGIIGFPEG